MSLFNLSFDDFYPTWSAVLCRMSLNHVYFDLICLSHLFLCADLIYFFILLVAFLFIFVHFIYRLVYFHIFCTSSCSFRFCRHMYYVSLVSCCFLLWSPSNIAPVLVRISWPLLRALLSFRTGCRAGLYFTYLHMSSFHVINVCILHIPLVYIPRPLPGVDDVFLWY